MVDKNGAFSGRNIIYGYPDGKTFLKGVFKVGIKRCIQVTRGILSQVQSFEGQSWLIAFVGCLIH